MILKSIRLGRHAVMAVMIGLLVAGDPVMAADIEKQQVEGTGCFTYGDDDTPASAKDRAFLLAKRNAVESYKSHVISKSTIRNFELEEDLAETIAEGLLYDTKITDTMEKGREICVKIRAFVKPAEIDRLLAERMAKAEDAKKTILSGEWSPYMKAPSKSVIEQKDGVVVWSYDVPKISDETYAGVNLSFDSISVKDRKIGIRLESTAGKPFYVVIGSFVAGYSKEDDEDTYVPVECEVRLKPGKQVVTLDPATCETPAWWRKENNVPAGIVFNPADIRQIDAVVGEDLGPISDTVRFEAVYVD